jgi:hypothetical protein
VHTGVCVRVCVHLDQECLGEYFPPATHPKIRMGRMAQAGAVRAHVRAMRIRPGGVLTPLNSPAEQSRGVGVADEERKCRGG